MKEFVRIVSINTKLLDSKDKNMYDDLSNKINEVLQQYDDETSVKNIKILDKTMIDFLTTRYTIMILFTKK